VSVLSESRNLEQPPLMPLGTRGLLSDVSRSQKKKGNGRRHTEDWARTTEARAEAMRTDFMANLMKVVVGKKQGALGRASDGDDDGRLQAEALQGEATLKGRGRRKTGRAK
jgi:hypothetical protein